MSGAVAPLMIRNASEDARFRDHPGLEAYGINSYIAVPLMRSDGSHFGTLCALDPLPAELAETDLTIFKLLSQLIAFQLEAVEKSEQREQVVLDLRESVQLREELVAIIGHDLRTPLTSISLAAAMIDGSSSVAESQELSRTITRASGRISRLLDVLIDFTRSRLGAALPIRRTRMDLRPLLEQLQSEIQVANPGRSIETQFRGALQGEWDPDRLAQAFANLLSNAVRYSPDDSVITLRAHDCNGSVEIEVHNFGEPIADLQSIFQPFQRGTPSEENAPGGLGLGLYITEQIVKAHSGTIRARSSAEKGTTFLIDLPRSA